MEDKIQVLTDKIYQEGIQKAKDEGYIIVNDARVTADKLISDARIKADQIITQAESEAKELRQNIEAEIRLASSQMVRSLRQKISELITLQVAEQPLKQIIHDEAFIKELILAAVAQWKETDGKDEKLLLQIPQNSSEALIQFLEQKIRSLLGQSFRIDLSQKLESGFKIGPDGGNYMISFTDEAFITFFKRFLRPGTIAILYGNDQK